ncbi:hypothetical protein M5K25_023020 [Dendrobium thyrsiflorum]|uniref:Uncharacterized protein n=1 Tax=Dendrobium thyrsiflorum TaxID=117978 RepID=A0ABD0U743_DENTH
MEVMVGEDRSSGGLPARRDPAVQNDGERRLNKGVKADDAVSTITGDHLTVLRKRFHFPNDLVVTVPKRSDRACLPPFGYLAIYEANLRAGLRFPPPPELIEILVACGVSLSQFSFRATSVTMGLIAFFKDRGAILTPEILSRMGRFTSDAQGRVTFRSKWLDFRTRDPSRSWATAFFFVKNDWGLTEKWGKLKDLPAPLHIGEEDITRILKVPDVEHLRYEIRYLSKFTEEEFLLKVGLSFQAGRSDAKMLKKSSKVPEPPAPASKVASKRPDRGDNPQALLKKKKLDGPVLSSNKVPPSSSPVKFHILEDVLNHKCIGRCRADDLLSRRMDLEVEFTQSLDEWNKEFVKVKYLQGEYKRKYDRNVKEMKVVEEELCECRTELANIVHSVSLQNQQIDRLQIDLVEAQAEVTQLLKDQKASMEKISAIEAENKRSQTLIAEKEAVLSEVKALEQQCTEEGFIIGFLKGVRLVQRKTGVVVEGLTPSQASGSSPSDSDGDEIESELQKAFALEVDDEIIDVE